MLIVFSHLGHPSTSLRKQAVWGRGCYLEPGGLGSHGRSVTNLLCDKCRSRHLSTRFHICKMAIELGHLQGPFQL